jgi:putative ABC transport system substrate-binding protein
MPALRQATRSVPIVFVQVADPVGAGLVDNLARPGGNVTGFMVFEFSMSGKWLELLKQIAPAVMRVAVLRDSAIGTGTSQFAAIQAVAPSLGVEAIPVNVYDAGEIVLAVDPDAERIQRIVRAAPRPEPVRDAEESSSYIAFSSATTARWTILSSRAATASGRCRPSGLGM